MLFRQIRRYRWGVLLFVLLLLNLIHYWPSKHPAASHRFAPGAGGGPPDPGMLQARLETMPVDQRAAIEERMKEDRQFFASVQNLPEAERRQKLREHFAQNPPPPGIGPDGSSPPGPPPDAGPGGPGDGGGPHIPPPDVRYGMDQGMVNAMKGASSQ